MRVSGLLFLLTLSGALQASYILPTIVAHHFVVADDWKIEGHTVIVKHAKKVYRFRIDLFWLADRINSDSICTGTFEPAMRAHVKRLAKKPKAKQKRPPLVLELVNLKKGAKLFVVGAWRDEGNDLFWRVKGGGAPRFLPYAVATKLKDKKALAPLLVKESAAGWKAITGPKKK